MLSRVCLHLHNAPDYGTVLQSAHHETCLCGVASPCTWGGMSTPAAVAVAAKHMAAYFKWSYSSYMVVSTACHHSLHGICMHVCSSD